MQEPQPPRLDYSGPRRHQPPPLPARPNQGYRVLWQMLLGLGIGTAFSAVVWIGGWQLMEKSGQSWPLFAVPVIKLIAGVLFLCIRGWRGLGGGVLLSLALGVLIFFGTCAAHMKV